MARPKKNNAQYFSHDTTMRNDLKVKALRNKYGVTGYAVWCMLLEVLTDSDNFTYKYDDLSNELLAADFGVEAETLKELIYYAVILQLIEIEDGFITCQNLNSRFKALIDKRERDRQRIQTTKKTQPTEIITYQSEFIDVKEIPAHLNSEDEILWREAFCMNNQLTGNQFVEKVKEFSTWLQDGGIDNKSKREVKEHFRNWYNKKQYGYKSNSRSSKGNQVEAGSFGLSNKREIKSAI